jgi:PAS domain S-box-containing protein
VESEARYRLLFEAAPVGIAITEKGGRLRAANLTLQELTGYTLEELEAINITDTYVDAGDRQRLLQALEATGSVRDWETDLRRKDGSVYCAVLNVDLMEVDGEAVLLTTQRDITSRKQAERDLLESLALNEATLATVPSFLLVLDADLNILMANDPCGEHAGLSATDAVGRNIADVFAEDLLQERNLLDHIRAVATMGGQHELLGVHHASQEHDDRYLDVRICGFEMGADQRADARRVLLVIDDVTHHQALEERARQTSRLESIGTLAGGVAHDFNNLLTGISGYASLLQMKLPAGHPMGGDLTTIGDLADRAAGLTRQLLAFSRQQRIEPIVADVNSLVENLAKMLRRLIGEDIELKLELAPDVASVLVDPGQIEQVLMNLAANARDAMPEGGRLTVETSAVTLDQEHVDGHPGASVGPHVLIRVSDTGCGMDEHTRQRIFEPFFTTKEIGKGTGLGLATVYGIVKQHNGNIWVHSELGQGTTFEVYLRAVPGSPTDAIDAGAAAELVGRSETVLVVEDEEIVLRVVEQGLEDHGFTVLAAKGAEEAERIFEAQGDRVSLLLTDLVMPGRLGDALFESLSRKNPSLKVLYKSGYTQHAVLDAHALGRDVPFIQKPFTPDALAQKVRGILGG